MIIICWSCERKCWYKVWVSEQHSTLSNFQSKERREMIIVFCYHNLSEFSIQELSQSIVTNSRQIDRSVENIKCINIPFFIFIFLFSKYTWLMCVGYWKMRVCVKLNIWYLNISMFKFLAIIYYEPILFHKWIMEVLLYSKHFGTASGN